MKTLDSPLNKLDPRAKVLRNAPDAVAAALHSLAVHLSLPEPESWTAKQSRRINRAIARRRHKKLTTWHLKNNSAAPIKSEAEIPKAIVRAVALKAALMRLDRATDADAAIEVTKHLNFADLRPNEKRAAELINGAKRAPKRQHKENPIEKSANRLRASIEMSQNPPRGRPEGSGSNKVRTLGLRYQVPLSAIDVCYAVLPIVEEITGSRIRPAGWNTEAPNDDPAFEVIVAAVNAVSATKRETVARAIYRAMAVKD